MSEYFIPFVPAVQLPPPEPTVLTFTNRDMPMGKVPDREPDEWVDLGGMLVPVWVEPRVNYRNML